MNVAGFRFNGELNNTYDVQESLQHTADYYFRRSEHESSGVHKGGFSKGGFSKLCVIIIPLLLNPPLLNPPLRTPGI